MRYLPLFLFATSVLSVSALAEEKAAAAKEEKITFDQHIVPIFREKCGSCHNANDKKGDLVLDNYGLAMQGGASGEVVRADGDASQSQLYLVITHMAEPKMPPQAAKLPDNQLELIRKWIEGGALENAGSKAKAKKTVVTKVTVSNQRPAGPPPLPESLPLDPLVVASRGNGITALATNPWSPLAAVAGHKQVFLYDTRTREIAGVLPFPEGVAHVLKFSRNGQWLIAGGGRGGQSGKAVVWDVKTGKRVTEAGSEYDVVLAADISPDHTQIALGGPKKIVRVYDTSTGELLYEKNKHTDWITAIEFSPDGVLLASGDRSNGLIVWEAFTGREFHVLPGHTAAVTDVSWSPDSNILASSSEDTTIRLWEMQNGGQIKNWGAHGGGVTAVEFTRDSRIATTGRDNVAKLWDLNGTALRAFGGLGDVGMEVAFDSETDTILAGDLTGMIQIWNAKDGAVLGQLSSNPPPLVRQIEQAVQALGGAEAAAGQATATLAALNKQLADRIAAAETAAKTAAAAVAELEVVTKAKAQADAEIVAKTQTLQTAETALTNAEAARNKASAERDAAVKVATDLRAKVKTATDAVTAAEKESSEAMAAFEAKPDDAGLKTANATASKKSMDALATLSELTKQSAAAVQEQTTKAEAASAAMVAFAAAKKTRETSDAEKKAADENVAKTTTKLKLATDAVTASKAAADKAAAEAVVTPEQQKQLTDTDTAVKTHTATAAALKAMLERLNAAKGRALQSLEASVQ
ncbi:c-type cytochrome domain-containing protein [Schlesneria paludicola]|uniref:c-type cytochrome domain-containing protein n=1 Tax=Schlesneria paludicola TaxID=360056 RepID=UPI00029B2E44|nr:c-type cytochrome domain-containing protein [Schlesneria paludicola]